MLVTDLTLQIFFVLMASLPFFMLFILMTIFVSNILPFLPFLVKDLVRQVTCSSFLIFFISLFLSRPLYTVLLSWGLEHAQGFVLEIVRCRHFWYATASDKQNGTVVYMFVVLSYDIF